MNHPLKKLCCAHLWGLLFDQTILKPYKKAIKKGSSTVCARTEQKIEEN
jgi:hypothetical protein